MAETNLNTNDREPWMRIITGWPRDLAVAGAFLTRLPFRPAAPVGMVDLSPAARTFPLIGLLVGGIAGGALWLGARVDLHPLACAFIGLAVGAWISGALHEDGLADFVDGLGGRDREHRLEIMRDSRIGSYGVLALIFSVGLKAALLAGFMGPGRAAGALIAAAVISRAVVPLVMARLAPARRDGLGQGVGEVNMVTALTALGFGLFGGVALLGPGVGLLALGMALCTALAVGRLARKRLGGYTGDVLGAVQQTAEVAVLIAAGAYAI